MNDNDTLRVLHIVNKWKQGGVENFIEGLISGSLDPAVHHSILSICTDISSNIDCPKFGPMYKGESMASMLLGSYKLTHFLLDHPFDIVHVHAQNSSGYLYCKIAQRHGIRCRIIHSHSSSLGVGSGSAKLFAQKIIRLLFHGSETERFACSAAAGDYLFPKMDYKIIPNGIDITSFAFDIRDRIEARQKIGISPTNLLVGCVGSLVDVKNHMRAVQIFDLLHRDNQMSRLVFVGDGELKNSLEREVARRNLDNCVIFLGYIDDVRRYYNSMDVLLFPSFHEGFPITLVEAQCNGLPVVASDSITPEVELTNLCRRLSLNEEDDVWVAALLNAERDLSNHGSVIIQDKGFSQENTIECIMHTYREAQA